MPRKLPITETGWAQMRLDYVLSGLSVKEIAEKYGVAYSTVQKHSVKEKWGAERAIYREAVDKAALEKAKEAAVEAESDKLLTLMQASDTLDEVLKDFFDRLGEEGKRITCQDLRHLTAALKDAIAIKRDLWYIPAEKVTEDEGVAIRMEVPEEYTV